MDMIMSTSIILLGQIFNPNDVNIMAFEPSALFPSQLFGREGEIDHMAQPRFLVYSCQVSISI